MLPCTSRCRVGVEHHEAARAVGCGERTRDAAAGAVIARRQPRLPGADHHDGREAGGVLGAGQAGLSAVAVNTSPRWLPGALVQWQKSFTGDSDRADVETATLQPFLIYKMSRGWFLRSTAIWSYNVKNDDYVIPLGLGGGRAMLVGNYIVNSFIEPQWTVAHRGDYQPEFTLYAGFSIMLK